MTQEEFNKAKTDFNNDLENWMKKNQPFFDLRINFVQDFSANKIKELTLEQYCIGSGNNNTFCYRLEHELKMFGNTSGRPGGSFMYGVYYSKKEGNYKISPTYNKISSKPEEAFVDVKNDIIQVLEAGKNGDYDALVSSHLDNWHKGKLLAIYFPDIYLTIYDRNRLKKYIDFFKINSENSDPIFLRKALVDYKNRDSVMKNWTIDAYSEFLSSIYEAIIDDEEMFEDAATESNNSLEELYQDIKNAIDENDKESLLELCRKALCLSHKRLTSEVNPEKYDKYLRALRTKPFLLLAGISGTGKSRIVREMAFRSCPKVFRDEDGTTPGNYCMIEVKPNWHDSTELLGYYSNIAQTFRSTKFINFLLKAQSYPNVPFFVCLDEMNLAPVEQYFAEFLSVLETRRIPDGQDTIKSGALVKADDMKYLGKDEELTLPQNVFIVGTVNMDDTTHQFSRKVIDRAMTIEMNGEDMENMFGHASDLEYCQNDEDVWTMDDELLTRFVNADEVLNAYPQWKDRIKQELPVLLEKVNKVLANTPFTVSYRVLNELTIYLGVLLDSEECVEDSTFNKLVGKAFDQILLMKVLPRIEGDEDMFRLSNDEGNEITDNEIINKLIWLRKECTRPDYDSYHKLEEMELRLRNGFTRFWP